MTKPSHILTRAERIAELDELSLHYDKTLQKENVKWAKVYRAGFPLDQVIPNENVCFQNGEVIDESDIDFEKGVMQDEVSSKDTFSYNISADKTYPRVDLTRII